MHDVPHESMPYAPTSLAQMDIDPALVDSSIGFTVLPFGVDHRNETVVGFWAGDPKSSGSTVLFWDFFNWFCVLGSPVDASSLE